MTWYSSGFCVKGNVTPRSGSAPRKTDRRGELPAWRRRRTERVRGAKKDRRCAFCDRSEGQVSFRQEKHIIPASMGNRILISNEECDPCNQLWGQDADGELAFRYAPMRALLGVRRRQGKKPYALTGTAGKSSITGLPAEGRSQISLDGEDPSISVEYLDGNTFRLRFPQPPVRPVGVIQAVLRSAWMLLTADQRSRLTVVRDTLSAPQMPLVYRELFVPGAYPNRAYLRVWEKRISKADGAANCIVEFRLGSLVTLWTSPAADGAYADSELPPVFVSVPGVAPNDKVTIAKFEIASNEALLLGTSASFTMSYESRLEGTADTSVQKRSTSTGRRGRATETVLLRLLSKSTDVLDEYGPMHLDIQRADDKRFRLRLRGSEDQFDLTIDHLWVEGVVNVDFNARPWGRTVEGWRRLNEFFSRMAGEDVVALGMVSIVGLQFPRSRAPAGTRRTLPTGPRRRRVSGPGAGRETLRTSFAISGRRRSRGEVHDRDRGRGDPCWWKDWSQPVRPPDRGPSQGPGQRGRGFDGRSCSCNNVQ